jgi:hypothetical protein
MIEKLYETSPDQILRDADVSVDGRLAILVEQDGVTRLVVDSKNFSEWTNSVRRVSWLSPGILAIWPFRGNAGQWCVLRLSIDRNGVEVKSPLSVGYPSDVFWTGNRLCCCYSEDQSLSAEDGTAEAEALAIFSPDGILQTGARTLLQSKPYNGFFLQISCACVTVDGSLWFSAYRLEDLWKLNTEKNELEQLPFEQSSEPAAIASFEKELFLTFVEKEALRILTVNTQTGQRQLERRVVYSSLVQRPELAAQRLLRLKGNANGQMLTAVDGVVLRISLA